MRIRATVPAAGLGLLALLVLPGPAVAAGTSPLFRLADSRLIEASGLAVGHRSPSVLYAQNDSGDTARFFALDARTGRTRAVCTVPGARNVDWEDLATGPDARGVPSVWLADIGDNDADRDEIDLYRVDEPSIPESDVDAAVVTSRPDVWRLRYPDGPRDAESLIVDPIRHRAYLVTKQLLGRSEVYAVPARPDPTGIAELAKVAEVGFSFTGTPGGPNPIGQLTATGASISADGRLLAIRTYTDAYLWPVSAGNVAAALRATPIRVPLPDQPQGEGIAVVGDRLLLDSEGRGSAVYSVPVPARARTAAGPSKPAPASSAKRSAQASNPAATSAPAPGPDRRPVVAVVAAAGLLAAAGAVFASRRRFSTGRRPGEGS